MKPWRASCTYHPRQSCDHARTDLCRCAVACPSFRCSKCNQVRPWCLGAADGDPDLCDLCYTPDPSAPDTDIGDSQS